MSVPKGVKLTPMLKQYDYWKRQYPDCLLFFRMGDFYEMFFEDAQKASSILGIALTARDSAREIPMAGVPYHAAENYIYRLIKAGFKVAICEQVTEPDGKNLVERKVVRVITPGTFVPADLPMESKLAAVRIKDKVMYLALLNCSSGRLEAATLPEEDGLGLLCSFAPSELVIPKNLKEDTRKKLLQFMEPRIVEKDPDDFDPKEGARRFCSEWGIATLEGFGFQEDDGSIGAAWAAYSYLRETQFGVVKHIKRIHKSHFSSELIMDYSTQKNLELIEGDKLTLFSVLNRCSTPMGKRLLKEWLLHPLVDHEQIRKRHDGVEKLLQNWTELQRLREVLSSCGDAEKALSRLGMGLGTPRDLGVIRDTLGVLPDVMEVVRDALIDEVLDIPGDPRDLRAKLESALCDELPKNIKDGNVIREGFDQELDSLRYLRSHSGEELNAILEREREKTGIKNMKIGFNKVFGYYLEISKSYLDKVPQNYIRKQTLVGGERFITEELKELEEKLMTLDIQIEAREKVLYESLVQEVLENSSTIQDISDFIATLDVLCSFAVKARECNYVRPTINDGYVIALRDARHPVVEEALGSRAPFTPNDVLLDSYGKRIAIVTGPNMAGKSTYLRMAALLVIMAQAGSFVPASKAEIGIIDRIFSRIGAKDELARGKSTFMVEMVETANILRNVTPRSLVILDEIGRGTSTYDGISIAWAVLEYLHKVCDGMPKVLFATHYHELASLADSLPGLFNLSLAVEETEKGIVFLYKLEPQPADKSYGVEVAKLAGVPEAVIKRSMELLRRFEEERNLKELGGEGQVDNGVKVKQLGLFLPEAEDLARDIASLDPDNLTPLGALELLYKLKDRAKEIIGEN
ncbi:MAG: mismatch repair protein MutS [Thermovirga sp.]|nr:mismatch repair protein MutS [Thermovirga sp.]